VRYWQDTRDVTPYDLNTYCTVLACEYDFVRKLTSTSFCAGVRLCSHKLPSGMTESHAWGEKSLYRLRETMTCKPAR
jgi:hypothetical protein